MGPVIVVGCADPVPCAPGYGRLADGACVAVQVADGGDETAAAGGGAVDTGTADSASPAAPWTAAEIEAAIGETLAVGPPTPPALRAAWIGVFDGAGDGCPGSGYDFTRGVDGCVSPAGWCYTGPADYDEVAGSTAQRWTLEADSTALRPDGTRLVAGGEVYWARQARDDGGVELRGSLVGTFEDSASTGWLGQGVSAQWSYTGSIDADGGLDVTLDGGWTPHGAPSIRVVSLQIGACAGLTGTLHVRRDTEARWATLLLDCAPCGDALLDGAPVGEVCVDDALLRAHLVRLGTL